MLKNTFLFAGNLSSDEVSSLVSVDDFASRLTFAALPSTNILNATNNSVVRYKRYAAFKVDFSLKHSARLLNNGNSKSLEPRHVENSATWPLLAVLKNAQLIFLSSSDDLKKRFWNITKSFLKLIRSSVCSCGASVFETRPVLAISLLLLIAIWRRIRYDIKARKKIRKNIKEWEKVRRYIKESAYESA